MKTRTNKRGLRGLALSLAMACALPALAANDSQGLRIVSAHGHEGGSTTKVEARIARTLVNRVLSPQRLRIAIVAADGSVRAEQQRLVGPAQMQRGSARAVYLSAELGALSAPHDRLLVEWVKAAL